MKTSYQIPAPHKLSTTEMCDKFDMARCNFKKLTDEHVKEMYLIKRPHPWAGLHAPPPKKNPKLTLKKHRLCRHDGMDCFT